MYFLHLNYDGVAKSPIYRVAVGSRNARRTCQRSDDRGQKAERALYIELFA